MPNPWPTPLPAWFWSWARWKDAGSPRGRRPVDAPRTIPAWAWKRYELHRAGTRRSSAFGLASCPFAGRGIFTVEHPEEVAEYGLRLDYTLSRLDAFTWTSTPGPGVVLQAETPSQYELALEKGAGLRPWARALVTNLAPFAGESWPDGWTCFLECYWNADGGIPGYGRSIPNMLYEARKVIGPLWGRVPLVVVPGLYDASSEQPGYGRRLTWPDYLPDIERLAAPVVGVCPWRVETLDPADVEGLK